MNAKYLLLVGLLASWPAAHATEVFTTTGKSGEAEYTDRPTGNSRRVELLATSAPAKPQTEEEAQSGRSFEDMSACEKAKHIVSKYENAELLADKDEKGNIRTLNRQETLAMIAKAREDEVRLCDGNNPNQGDETDREQSDE